MSNHNDRQPSDAYMEVLDTLERGHKPTPEQLIALKRHDPVVRTAVNTALTELLEDLQMLLTIRRERIYENQ